jgi:hypothetical protein
MHSVVSVVNAGDRNSLLARALRVLKLRQGQTMVRSTYVVVLLLAASFGLPAYGQETGGGGSVPKPPGSAPGQPLNSDHLAPTGKTLPHPGVPQASGTTDLDRSVQRQDDRTQESICKGC